MTIAIQEIHNKIEETLSRGDLLIYKNALLLLFILEGTEMRDASSLFSSHVTDIELNTRSCKKPPAINVSNGWTKSFPFPTHRLARKVIEFYFKNRGENRDLFRTQDETELMGYYRKLFNKYADDIFEGTIFFESLKPFFEEYGKVGFDRLFRTETLIKIFNRGIQREITQNDDNIEVSGEKLKELKETIKNGLNLHNFEKRYYSYVCVNKCGREGRVWAHSLLAAESSIKIRGSVCLECVNEAQEKRRKEKNKKAEERHKREEKINQAKTRERIDEVLVVRCVACGIQMTDTRHNIQINHNLCPECKKEEQERKNKAREKSSFYKGLSRANDEVAISKRRVYGQGKYELMQIKNTNVGNRRWETVDGQELEKRIKASNDGADKEEKYVDSFIREVEVEVDRFVNSEKGKAFMFTDSMKEELIFTAQKYHFENKFYTAQKCIELALGE